MRSLIMTLALSAALAAPARSGQSVGSPMPAQLDPAHVEAAVRLMASLRDVSQQHAVHIREAYQDEVRHFSLRNRQSLASAHADGLLTTLFPFDRHNVSPRLDGRNPIGELDLPHQALYVAARPETIGCLLEVASRVQSGALEVTSLVRHRDYQHALARGNANARTDVPTHAMGLAFDISILHTPIETAREIRDVLERMAADGDLFFVAEQRQLVFHVVPAPERREHFTGLTESLAVVPRPAQIEPPAWTVLNTRAFQTPDLPQPPVPEWKTAVRPSTQYAGLVGWLFLSGLGVPPGEDLLIAAAGALVGRGMFAWWPVILLAASSVVATDALIFWLGRTTARFARRPRLLPARSVARLDAFIGRWGRLAVALARFVPGSRALVFASAGARGLRPRTFLLIDACAALAWVALLVTIGTWVVGLFFGGDLTPAVGVNV